MKNFGFIAPQILETDYIFGGLQVPDEILMPDSHGWEAFLPVEEFQKKKIETYACTAFGTLNCVETIQKKKYGIEDNYSDRFTAIVSGNTPQGNNPQAVAEAIRKIGLIDEEWLPFTEYLKTWEEFHSPNPMNRILLDRAKEWLKQWDFKHEYLRQPYEPFKPETAIEALKRSPLGVSVHAWAENENGLFYKAGPPNHWVMLYDFVQGTYWNIFDHYDQTHKKLVWDYDFDWVKVYHLKKKGNPELKTDGGIIANSPIGSFIRYLKRWWDEIMK